MVVAYGMKISETDVAEGKPAHTRDQRNRQRIIVNLELILNRESVDHQSVEEFEGSHRVVINRVVILLTVTCRS